MLSIAALSASLNVDGHRADLVILKTARAHAAFEGHRSITDRDIALAAELALPHRIKRGPFHQAEITMEDLQERIEQLQGATQGSGEPEVVPEKEQAESPEKKKG
jgi:Mg-chelatase subunit ChlI